MPLLAAQILAQHDAELHQRIADWRKAQTDEVLENPDPRGRYEASLRSHGGLNNWAGMLRQAGEPLEYRRLAGWSGCGNTAVRYGERHYAEIERAETACANGAPRPPSIVMYFRSPTV